MAQVAIVTGGASGIGLNLTKHLVAKGWRVVVADIDAVEGKALERDLGSNVIFQQTDVSDWDSQLTLFKRAIEWGDGKLDFLAANAGINGASACEQVYQPTGGVEPDKPDLSTINVNLAGVIYSVHLFKFYSKNTGGNTGGENVGKIVITSSVFGVHPLQTSPYYAASKHGVIGFMRSIAPVFKRDGITVNAILPSFVVTKFVPADRAAIIPAQFVTSMETITAAYDRFLDDPSLSGETIEIHPNTIVPRKLPEYAHESMKFFEMATRLDNKPRVAKDSAN